MPYGLQRNLLLTALFTNVFTPANVQVPMPMYMPAPVPPPVLAVPAPVPVVVAIQLPERTRKTTTTTTTTSAPESPNFAIAMPVPVPMPMPIAVPAPPPPHFCQAKPKPPSCPPCPPCICLPSCTPAFFSYCSPCHQQCRCRSTGEAPNPKPLPPYPPSFIPGPAHPLPMPMFPAPIGPPPVVVVPMPPIIKKPIRPSSSSDDTSDSCTSDDWSSDSSFYSRKRKRVFKKRPRNYRRNAGYQTGDSDNDKVKPVLSYVSQNGDVKFKSIISDKDALEILNKRNTRESGEKQAFNNDEDSEVIVLGQRSGGRYNKVVLRDSPTNQVLKKQKSKFIFKPPPNKKINNVAVSFHVT